jgi:hypothetical protein
MSDEKPYFPDILLNRLMSHIPEDSRLTINQIETFCDYMVETMLDLSLSDKQMSVMFALFWVNELWESRQAPSNPDLFKQRDLDTILAQFLTEFESQP